MADDKKPKIDLKARRGKAAAAPAPTPAPVPQVTPSGRPIPMPPPSSQPPEALGYGPPAGGGGLKVPTPMGTSPSGLPIPMPMPGPSPFAPPGIAPGGFDPSNPLAAAVASPYQAPARPAAPPEPQRIEIDELTIQQATKASLRKGIFMGCGLAVMAAIVAYVAGGAQEQAAARKKAQEGAVDLATNAGKAKDQLKLLADKMEAGRKSLITDHKFPDTLARELGAINVDFDGKQLEGRRFNGFSSATTSDLVSFISSVQAANDRKALIVSLLTKLEKPITEQLKIPEGQVKVNYVVAIDHDANGNMAALLSHLAEPIVAPGGNVAVPADFTFSTGGSNSKLPAYKSGDLASKPAAIYVVPKSFDTVCPSASGGQVVQLGAQIGNFINDVRGEGAGGAPSDTVSDAKPGLLERVDKLIKELGTVGT